MSGPQRRRNRVVHRRRQAFMRLLVAVGATLVLGLIPKLHGFLVAHAALDVGLALYVVQLRRWRLADIARARSDQELAAQRSAEERIVQPIEHIGDDGVDEEIPLDLAGTAASRSG